ncbi:MAG: dihydroneopterin aldolase [Nocardioidaceae bacterium]|jgi:dihydroneopterin aldolase|nr:dihydroneopterin aldolase [Nocardioidaceae bacterium]MDQ3324702.1 dihydroneopterin aldolase [Actinomycetota bacterium]
MNAQLADADHHQDRICITGLRARGHHGLLDHERRDGQDFVVDVVLFLDLSPAGNADDLSLTVDYGALAQRVHEAVESDPVDLIETLAQRIATLCLSEQPVRRAVVTVHKPQAPVPVPVTEVAVTIERSRS